MNDLDWGAKEMVPNLRSCRTERVSQNKSKEQTLKKISKPASCQSTSKTAPNRQLKKKKDMKLHKLIFEEGGLLDGTEVEYIFKGKPLRKGNKEASKICCSGCNKTMSPSEFEKHAGMGSNKRPYSYLHLKNGISLHEVALYLREIRSAKDNGKVSADDEKFLLCDGCRSFFDKDSASLPMNTHGEWHCKLCKKNYMGHNSNTAADGRVAEGDSMIQTAECTTCVVRNHEGTDIVCALCRGYNYCNCKFGPLALIVCVQCEKEFHVRCLKKHRMSVLKAKPKGKWFCSSECKNIFSTLQRYVADAGEDKFEDGGSTNKAVRWKLLCAKSSSTDDRLVSEATSIFRVSLLMLFDVEFVIW